MDGRILLSVMCLIIGSGFFSGCQKDKKPEGLLTHEQMVEVLKDIYLSEEKVNRLNLPQDSSVAVFQEMEQLIFQKAQIRDSVFKQSFDYYFERPNELQLIYSALVDSLQLLEEKTQVVDYTR